MASTTYGFFGPRMTFCHSSNKPRCSRWSRRHRQGSVQKQASQSQRPRAPTAPAAVASLPCCPKERRKNNKSARKSFDASHCKRPSFPKNPIESSRTGKSWGKLGKSRLIKAGTNRDSTSGRLMIWRDKIDTKNPQGVNLTGSGRGNQKASPPSSIGKPLLPTSKGSGSIIGKTPSTSIR